MWSLQSTSREKQSKINVNGMDTFSAQHRFGLDLFDFFAFFLWSFNLQLTASKGPQPFDCLIGVRSVEDLPIKVWWGMTVHGRVSISKCHPINLRESQEWIPVQQGIAKMQTLHSLSLSARQTSNLKQPHHTSISNSIYWSVHHLPLQSSWDSQRPQTLGPRKLCWAKQQVSTPHGSHKV